MDNKSNGVDANLPALVIDNGSGMVKAGFGGEDKPSVVFPSIIGTPKYKKTMKHGDQHSAEDRTYVGNDAYDNRGILKLRYPVEHGIVTDWDSMEAIWEHTFDQLRVEPDLRNVLLTEAPRNPKKNREKMAEIMFETFDAGGLYIAIQGVLSLFASGRTTGTVLDIGDGVTHTIPIYDGYAVSNAINRYDLAGRDVTEYMVRLLEQNGTSMTTSSEREIVRRIKERLAYCAIDPDEEAQIYSQRDMSRNYTLPDGNKISIGDTMFLTPEVLFDPGLIGKEIPGVHTATFESINACDINLRKDLYSNIVLSGGTTMIRDFDKRLQKELEQLVNNIPVKVVAPEERKYSVWMGGSILSMLPSFQNAWIYNYEYKECGKMIVHSRCM